MKDAPVYRSIREEREDWEKKFRPNSPAKAVELLDLIAQPESPAWAIYALKIYILRLETQHERRIEEMWVTDEGLRQHLYKTELRLRIAILVAVGATAGLAISLLI